MDELSGWSMFLSYVDGGTAPAHLMQSELKYFKVISGDGTGKSDKEGSSLHSLSQVCNSNHQSLEWWYINGILKRM